MARISLFSPLEGDYTSRSAELARQQKLAQMLMEMSQQEMPVSTAGGITAPVSPYGALAKALTSFGGSYLSGKSERDAAALDKASRAEALDARSALYEKPGETATLPGQEFNLKGVQPDYTPNVNSEFPEAAPKQNPLIAALKMGDINYNLPATPRSYEEQNRMLDELDLSSNPYTARMATSARARIEAERDRNQPKMVAAGANGMIDSNPNSKTYGQRFAVPPKDLEAPKTAGGLQWTPDKGWTEIPGYTAQAEKLAEARHITIENPNNAKLSPDDLDFMARQALTGDTSVFAGLGYGSVGAQNRSLLRSKITQVAKEKGMKPEDVAAMNAQFFGTKSGERTLGTRTANIGMAVAEATQLMPLALSASEKVNRTQFPTLNSILIAGEKGVGDENVVRLGIATNSLINTYARAINPTGIPTVSDKDHARELLVNAWSKGQYAAGVNQLKLEMDAAKKSPGIVREEFRTSISGTTPAPATDIEAILKKHGVR